MGNKCMMWLFLAIYTKGEKNGGGSGAFKCLRYSKKNNKDFDLFL